MARLAAARSVGLVPASLHEVSMLAPNAYVIRTATPADAATLRRLATLDSQRPLDGPALIGELDGEPAAALSLADGRIVADPFRPTLHLGAHLRVRAESLRAHAATPS